jgi:hypothetical protein
MASDPRELRWLQNGISKGLLRRSFRISSVQTKISKPLLVCPRAGAQFALQNARARALRQAGERVWGLRIYLRKGRERVSLT